MCVSEARSARSKTDRGEKALFPGTPRGPEGLGENRAYLRRTQGTPAGGWAKMVQSCHKTKRLPGKRTHPPNLSEAERCHQPPCAHPNPIASTSTPPGPRQPQCQQWLAMPAAGPAPGPHFPGSTRSPCTCQPKGGTGGKFTPSKTASSLGAKGRRGVLPLIPCESREWAIERGHQGLRPSLAEGTARQMGTDIAPTQSLRRHCGEGEPHAVDLRECCPSSSGRVPAHEADPEVERSSPTEATEDEKRRLGA